MKLLVAGRVPEEMRKFIDSSCRTAGLQHTYVSDASKNEMRECDVLFLGFGTRERLSELINGCERLRMLQTESAGVDYIDFASVPPETIVCSNAGAFAEPIAEHVFAMILSLAKNLKKGEMAMRNGIFGTGELSLEMRGSILGIFGYGGIGREVAKLGRLFGMKIYAISRNISGEPQPDWSGGTAELDSMLSAADVVVISAPLNLQTRNLFDRNRFDKMKRDAILINVARGGIIVEEDLYRHVVANEKFRVGIDTWWNEPGKKKHFTPRYDFLALPNVIGSPHNSEDVQGIEMKAVRRAFDNIFRFARGEKPLNIVKREDYMERT
ncbi:MAG: hydroxyacid dehydrogenase [Thermoplasmata archaeon]|uniref:Hydroxyacid dehydrogenase n=1 Tax=Candidatus Sysuiplasma superficiale TaxID=2823368 RepID=A0A8J8CCG8_9ARCH|nr:hydroxyacid dehydrogenase [Candidatus Sysuiplasma superficiale]